MVTTLLKTSLREIRQSLGRYLAILAIAGLGVGFFAGLRTCQPSMAATGIDYLEQYRLFDFRLLSTLGFTEEDVARFAGLEGIAAARGAVYTDFLTEIEAGEELVLKAHSLTDGVNLPKLASGRMPQAPNECLADARRFSEEDLGRVLTVSPNNDADTKELLYCGEYTIVGTALSPYYLNYERGTSSIGSGSVYGFVYIPEEGFDFAAYYEIFLSIAEPAAAYSDAYSDQIDRLKPAVSSALEDRAAVRYAGIYDEAMAEIRDAEQEIADGWDEYRSERTDAENELNDAYRELTDGERAYTDGLRDYEKGRREYADGLRDYEDGRQKAADAEQEIADAEQKLADAEQELSDARQKLTEARQELDDGWAEYEQAKSDTRQELEDAHQELLDGLQEYLDGEAEYADGLLQLEDAEKELADAEKELRDGEQELSDGERDLSDAWETLQDARRELDDAEAQISAAKTQLDEGEASYAQVRQLYDSTEQLAQGIGAGMGINLDAGTLISYLESGASPELNAAVDIALQNSGTSAAELAAGWRAAEAQLGAPLSSETVAGLRSALDQAQREYQEGVKEYRDGYAQYQNGLAEYRDGKAELSDARRELDDGWAVWEDGRRELEEARAELSDARRKLDDASRELDRGWRDYYSGAEEAQTELDKAYRELTGGEDEYADGLQKYQDGVEEYEDGRRDLEDGRQELSDAWQELEDARQKLADARDELNRVPGELSDAQRELDDGWAEYGDGKAEADQEFADAEQELTDAEQKLADAYEDLKDLKHASTYTLTRNENTGYVCFDNDTSIIAAISVVFPVFFFLVAALVCMTTMTRMVDEQRTQIGVLKALGYSNGQIMGKYLFYSGSAALTGSTIGFFAGSYGLPWIIWVIYGMIYGFAPLRHVFLPGLMLLSFAAALLCSMGATYLACRMELKRQPAQLLRPKTPRAGKRVFLEYITPLWKRLSFLHKVSVRNVLRYRSRLIMMVLGIGGCTALLVTGFGIRDSIQHVADYQFDEIDRFDFIAAFQDAQTPQSADAFLTRRGWDPADGLLAYSGSIDILTEDASKSVYLAALPEENSPERFISFHSGDVPIPFPGPDEAVLNIGLAQSLGISQGDTVRLRDEEYGTMEVIVSGIMDNYVQNYVYISTECYEQQFGEPVEYNTLYVLGRPDAGPYEDGARLLEDDSVSSVTVNQATRDQINSMLSSLDYIVVVVVACAAALAFIVLYNLTNINITERVREIATIKVLGFYPNETASYVFREINILSVLGSLAGLLLGRALHAFVMSQIRIDAMFFPTRITFGSYFLSLVMTMLFTFGISLGMRPKLHQIDMAESLKSIE